MRVTTPWPLLLAAVLLAGCQPQSREGAGTGLEADPATAASPTSRTPAADDVVDVLPPDVPLDPNSTTGFDMRGFAGTFTGTLPCASCPGIETTLVLQPDGRYRLIEEYLDEPDGRLESEGSWSAEGDGTRLLLDPSGKEHEDRSYSIVDAGTLRLLAPDGRPIDSALDYQLRRNADTPTG